MQKQAMQAFWGNGKKGALTLANIKDNGFDSNIKKQDTG